MIKFLLFFLNINVFAESLNDAILKAKSGDIFYSETLNDEKNKLDLAGQFSQYLLPNLTFDAGIYSIKPIGQNTIKGAFTGNTALILPNNSSSILTYGATLNQNLSIYKIIPAILYIKEMYKMNQITYDLFIQNFTLSVVGLYMNILSTQKSIIIYNQKLEIMMKEFNTSQIKAKYGILNKNQLNLIEARIFEIKNKIKELELQLKYYSNEYKILTKTEPKELSIPETQNLPFASKEDFLERVKINNINIKSSIENVKLSKLEHTSSIVNLMPDIYGTVGYKAVNSMSGQSTFMFNNLYFGAVASFMLNSPRDNVVNVAKASKKLKIAESQSNSQQSQALLDAEMIWGNYFINQDSYKASELKINTLSSAIEDLKIKMSYGTSNLIQYLQAENDLLEAELYKINSQKNIVINYYKIFIMAGLDNI